MVSNLHQPYRLVNCLLTCRPKDRQPPLLRNRDALEMHNIGLMMSVSKVLSDAYDMANLLGKEFAFEIGSSLLTEVRRLQSLLGERDKAIQDMKEEKDDLEKAVENLRVALKTQEQNAGVLFLGSVVSPLTSDFRQVQRRELESRGDSARASYATFRRTICCSAGRS